MSINNNNNVTVFAGCILYVFFSFNKKIEEDTDINIVIKTYGNCQSFGEVLGIEDRKNRLDENWTLSDAIYKPRKDEKKS